MREITIVCVGKLKSPGLDAIEKEYSKRLSAFKLNIVETRAHDDNCDLEAQELCRKIKEKSRNPWVILLTEDGKKYNSQNFSQFLFEKIENNHDIFFVLNGAAGPGKEILNLSKIKLSLSDLTFPHKLARLILIEQLYRAETIKMGHPYHK